MGMMCFVLSIDVFCLIGFRSAIPWIARSTLFLVTIFIRIKGFFFATSLVGNIFLVWVFFLFLI